MLLNFNYCFEFDSILLPRDDYLTKLLLSQILQYDVFKFSILFFFLFRMMEVNLKNANNNESGHLEQTNMFHLLIDFISSYCQIFIIFVKCHHIIISVSYTVCIPSQVMDRKRPMLTLSFVYVHKMVLKEEVLFRSHVANYMKK